MARAQYQVIRESTDAIYLLDENRGGMSVTNDAESVVAEVTKGKPTKRIFYRDTQSDWGELVHNKGVFQRFAFLSDAEREARRLPKIRK